MTSSQPVYVTRAPGGDHAHLVVRRCGGPRSCDAVTRVLPRGRRPGHLRRRAGAAPPFDPGYEKSGLSTSTTPTQTGDERIVEYQRADDPPRRSRLTPRAAGSTTSPRTTTAACCFGPDGDLYAGMATGRRRRSGADRPGPGQPLGKLLRIDPREGLRGRGARLATRGASRSAGRPGLDRRRRPGRARGDRRRDRGAVPLAAIHPNFGWSAFEGTGLFNADQQAPSAIPPVYEYGRDGGCSVTGGYVVRDPGLESLYGRYLYGDFCEGELHSSRRAVPRARDDRALGLRVEQLSSFGEDVEAAFVVSLAGQVVAAQCHGHEGANLCFDGGARAGFAPRVRGCADRGRRSRSEAEARRGAGRRPRLARSRVRRAGLRRRRPARANLLFVVEQPGRSGSPRRQDGQPRLPRHPRPGLLRRRGGPALGRLRPGTRATGASTSTTSTGPGTSRSTASAARRATRPKASAHARR